MRTQAVVVVCDLARANLKSVPHELISRATERLRDKKVPFRKQILYSPSMELYHPVWDLLGPSQAHFGGGDLLCTAYETPKLTLGRPEKDECRQSSPT